MTRLSELKSNGQNSRPIKIATALPDDIITQREDSAGAMEDEEHEAAEGEQESATTEARPRRRKSARAAEAVTRVEPEEKLRGKRQKDFDISEQNDSSDEEKQRKERTRAAEEAWTQSQQKLLELALQQYPKGASDRWDKIAKCVPSKSKVCNTAGEWVDPCFLPRLTALSSMPHWLQDLVFHSCLRLSSARESAHLPR
jgi:DnaJ family protein C protein 1